MDTDLHVKPIVTFGVLADVQYADCDDRVALDNYAKTRYYRGSLNQVDKAFNYWKESALPVKFVLQLGDIIDGLNRIHGGSRKGMRSTLEHFEQNSSIPTFHTVGNHELYNFDRKELASLFYESITKINIPPAIFSPIIPENDNSTAPMPVLYYKFCPVPDIKCVSLDCFDISVLGYDESHPNYQEASKLLYTKHGHSVYEEWDSDGPLEGLHVRFQQMNGALGREQMLWLDQELEESDKLGQKVIVFGHVSLNPDSSDWSCLLWNYDEVVEIFHRHRCVIAYFNGHTHESGYAVDSHGISYVTCMGIVETPPDTFAFATISVYPDRLQIEGQGLECSYNVPLPNVKDALDGDVMEKDLETSPSVKVEV